MKLSITHMFSNSQKAKSKQDTVSSPYMFEDECNESIPDEDSVSNGSGINVVQSTRMSNNVLVTNKGGIKANEKDGFLYSLEKMHDQIYSTPNIIQLKACRKSNTSKPDALARVERRGRRTTRKITQCNKVRRSTTVAVTTCFGPKILSPCVKTGKKYKKGKKVRNKESTSTLKSKLTAFSSSRRLGKSYRERSESPAANERSRSAGVPLPPVPENLENGALLTIMDL